MVNETRRRFYKRHKIREQTQARSVYWKLRQEVINKLGGKCINCGITDIKVLEINHVHGGGTKHLKKVGTTMHLYDIKSNRTNRKYDIRCANCNRLYEYERGNYYSE